MPISIVPVLEISALPGQLLDDTMSLIQADAALNATIPQTIRPQLEGLLRVVNSYYSNKIEGNPTTPAEVLRAHKHELDEIESRNKGLVEMKRHLELQLFLHTRYTDIMKDGGFATSEGIKTLHKMFYLKMPEDFLYVEKKDGSSIPIVPGEYRKHDVEVGIHLPPLHNDVERYMKWFEMMYKPNRYHATQKILAAAASHHRLMWIHPFIDGNGRTGRLFTDLYMKEAGLGSYGLWTMSRGFSLNKAEEYYRALSAADHHRKGDRDGRGLLSDSGLITYLEYFISTALKQVRYFTGLLDSNQLKQRVDIYFEMRNRQAVSDEEGHKLPPLKIESKEIYRMLLDRGPMRRSEIYKALGKTDKTISPTIKQMETEGLVKAPARMPVELDFSTHSIQVLFPNLFHG